MKRPFVSASIDDLEANLEEAIGANDSGTIKAIAFELTHRRTPRAKELADRVANLSAAGSSSPTRSQRSTLRSVAGDQSRGSKAPSHKPTAEQDRANELFPLGGSLRINAYAGAGKTSTLQMLAHSTNRRGQYIAFNRSIVGDAKDKFPKTIECSTTHGLAYRSTPDALRRSSDKMTGRTSAQQLAEILGLKKTWRVDQDHTLQPRSQAYLILETIKRYAQSGDDEIVDKHVPRHGSLRTANEQVLAEVTDFARRGAAHVWARMRSPEDELPLGHDGYLKLWALSRPQIAADFILLDEAQDTNPVVLEVLREQKAQLVYVGDRYQQIYEWRGAINAMEAIETEHSVGLTQSFRFGPQIAAAASVVLQRLGERSALVGNPALSSRVGPCIPDTILARTNANVMTALVDALNDGRSPHLVGGTGELMEMLRGVQDLKQGTPSTVPEFFGFQNWNEVEEFSKTQEGEHLTTFVNLVDSRGERQLMWALGRSVEEKDANIILSTAHKSKGREWDNVRLMDDFVKSRPEKSDDPLERERRDKDSAAELRLFYVAMTRARKAIDIPETVAEMLGIKLAAGSPEIRIGRQASAPASSPITAKYSIEIPALHRPNDWQQATPVVDRQPPAALKKRGFLARLLGL